MSRQQPNIVVLICDGMRFDAMGAVGQTPCQTPTWDRMAAEGALLAEHRTTGPMCSPARASILTGMQPHQAGMPGISAVYTQAERTGAPPRWPGICREPLSQPLREAGYDAYYAGKWHVGENNILQWFDRVACCENGDRDYSEWCRLHGVPDGFIFHDPVRGKPYRSSHEPGMSLYRPGILDIPEDKEHNLWVLGHAMEFVADLRCEKPFLFFLSFEGPHPPVVVPREYYDMYDPADVRKPDNWDANAREPSFLNGSYYRTIRNEWSDDFEDWRKPIAVWWGYVTYVDRLFGLFLDRLGELGHLDNTAVVMLADHGDMFGCHELSQIFVPYDEVLHVPCVIRAPGRVAPGVRCEIDTSHVDIAPTILAAAGLEPSADAEGENLLPYLTGARPGPAFRDTFCQYNMSDYFRNFQGVEDWRSILRRPYKYVLHRNGEAELFDIESDPGEMRNLAGLADAQAKEADLRRALLASCRRTGDAFVDARESHDV